MVRNAEGGKVHVSEVMPLLKAQSVKPKDVIASLKGEIFWSRGGRVPAQCGSHVECRHSM